MKGLYLTSKSPIYPTMTVGDLIRELEKLPNKEKPVFVYGRRDTSCQAMCVKAVSVKENNLDGYILIDSEE